MRQSTASSLDEGSARTQLERAKRHRRNAADPPRTKRVVASDLLSLVGRSFQRVPPGKKGSQLPADRHVAHPRQLLRVPVARSPSSPPEFASCDWSCVYRSPPSLQSHHRPKLP